MSLVNMAWKYGMEAASTIRCALNLWSPTYGGGKGKEKGSAPSTAPGDSLQHSSTSIQGFKFLLCSSQSFFSLISMSVWLIPVRAHPSCAELPFFPHLSKNFPLGLCLMAKAAGTAGPFPPGYPRSPSLLLCKTLPPPFISRSAVWIQDFHDSQQCLPSPSRPGVLRASKHKLAEGLGSKIPARWKKRRNFWRAFSLSCA